MALTVVVRTGATESPGLSFDAPRVVIGRGEGCEVRLPDPSVSHRHASLRQRGPDWVVMDEGSTNGTWLGPVKLAPQAPRVVRHGELVRVGRIWLELRLEHALVSPQTAGATRELALALVSEALAAAGEAHAPTLQVVSGPDAGKSLSLARTDHPYVLGRGRDAGLALEEPDASRRHCEVQRRAGQLWVRDLGSKNGTRLGDVLLDGGAARPWPPGVALQIGADTFTYADPVAEALAELERSADEPLALDEAPPEPGAPPPPLPPTTASDAALEGVLEAAPAAPVATPARAARPSTRRPVARGWSLTDTVVALLALTVLTVSVIGIFWLFRLD